MINSSNITMGKGRDKDMEGAVDLVSILMGTGSTGSRAQGIIITGTGIHRSTQAAVTIAVAGDTEDISSIRSTAIPTMAASTAVTAGRGPTTASWAVLL